MKTISSWCHGNPCQHDVKIETLTADRDRLRESNKELREALSDQTECGVNLANLIREVIDRLDDRTWGPEEHKVLMAFDKSNDNACAAMKREQM